MNGDGSSDEEKVEEGDDPEAGLLTHASGPDRARGACPTSRAVVAGEARTLHDTIGDDQLRPSRSRHQCPVRSSTAVHVHHSTAC